MPRFSRTSLDRLLTCDERLQAIMQEVVSFYDCSILEGHRSQAKQDHYFATGRSKVRWPNGKHNSFPSKAVDASPYPIDWGDSGTSEERRKALARFYFFAGIVMAVAERHGVKLRWGGDWDGDGIYTDQTFDDLVHFEIDE